jgi:hypothetical protein
VAGCFALVLSCSIALTACASGDAKALASQACTQVEHGLAAETKAARVDHAQAVHLQAVALADVRAALPFAAEAAGDDTTWQALEATLSESNRVPLRYLWPALTAQCANSAGDG